MYPSMQNKLNITRRHFLRDCQLGLGGIALTSLMGSWVTYGLGSESQNLPGFIALVSSGTFPSAGNSDWNNGFLPSIYQGVQCRSQGDPVLYVSNPGGMDSGMRRISLDALRDLNELQAVELGNPETRTRIEQYELAFRMQTAVPEVMDISR